MATRPANVNGLGWDVATASEEIGKLRVLFKVLPYTNDVLETWHALVRDLGVSGKWAHDAHLAAIMKVHSVSTVLTFNGSDFKRFPGITVLHPSDV